MKIALCYTPRDRATLLRVAALAERAGVSRFGIADSPFLYGEAYLSMQAVLEHTERIAVGTLVTNPVTRHWSVAAAAHRTLDQLAPGRTFLGIAAGDSAVHTAGLAPAAPAQLSGYLRRFRAMAPASVRIMVAAGGPKSGAVALEHADDVLLGQGASAAAIDTVLGQRAAGGPQRWLFLMLNLCESAVEVAQARADLLGPVLGMSRNAFSAGYAGRDVPEALRRDLDEVYADYEFSAHAQPGDTPNARLLADRPRLAAFLLDRFGLVGTAEQVLARLRRIRAETGVDGVVFSIIASDPEALLALAAERVLPNILAPQG